MGCCSAKPLPGGQLPETPRGSGRTSRGTTTALKYRCILQRKDEAVQDVYESSGKTLGASNHCSITAARHRDTKKRVAIKSIPKKDLRNIARFEMEVEIMRILDHPNIVKLHEFFEDAKSIYLVMELCEGGELFEAIVQETKFTEGVAAMVMKQVLMAAS